MLSQGARIVGVAIDHKNREEQDFYPTPPEAVEALLDRVPFVGSIWEPACGDGAISRVLEQRGHHVFSTDLIDRGYGTGGVDFLKETVMRGESIITNPPFKLANEFIEHACGLATGRVALLLRLQALEGQRRRKIFQKHTPAQVLVFSKRLSMHRRGVKTGKSGGMMAFAWFVWDKDYDGPTTLGWL